MFSNAEQFTSATKAMFESQIESFHALGSKTIEGVEKTIALNLAAAKASVEQSIAVGKQLSSAKDPQEFFALSAAQAKPVAENVASYNRHLSDIAAGFQAAFTKAAETQFADTNGKIAALLDNVTKNVQAGSEQLTKPARKAVETVEAQAVTATEPVSQAVQEAAPKAAKK